MTKRKQHSVVVTALFILCLLCVVQAAASAKSWSLVHSRSTRCVCLCV